MFTPKESISAHLQSSGGSFLMLLSSCVQYELLDIKQKEGYKPSNKFYKINKPVPGENINDTLLECLSAPELYKKMLAQFKDKPLPSESGLANILDRTYEVKGNASLLAAKVFLKNLTYLSLITDDRILKIDSIYISFEEQKNEDEKSDNNKVNDTDLSKKKEQTVLIPQKLIRTSQWVLSNLKQLKFRWY